MRLSPHFTLAEFVRSDTADRLGDANRPTPAHLANLRVTAAGFEVVRDILGGPILITSGYRNPRVNRAVRGTPTSDHPQGWAGDFRHPRRPLLECAQLLADAHAARRIRFDQLIYEVGRCVHVSFNPRMRGQVLTQRGGPGSPFTVGLP